MDVEVLQCLKPSLDPDMRSSMNCVCKQWLSFTRATVSSVTLTLSAAERGETPIEDDANSLGGAAGAAAPLGMLLQRNTCAAVAVHFYDGNPYLQRWWTALRSPCRAHAQQQLQGILASGLPTNCRQLMCDAQFAQLKADADYSILECVLNGALYTQSQLSSDTFFGTQLLEISLPQVNSAGCHRPSDQSVSAGTALANVLQSANLPRLKTLNLAGWCLASTHAAADAFGACLRQCPALQEVSIGHRHEAQWQSSEPAGQTCPTTHGWSIVLQSLLNCQHLSSISLHCLALGSSSGAGDALIRGTTQGSTALKSLALHSCNISSTDSSVLLGLAAWPCNLAALSLTDCSGNAAAWCHSADCLYAHRETLQSLQIESCNVGVAGWLEGLAVGLWACRSLTRLSIRRLRLDLTCTQALCGVVNSLKALKHIDIGGNTLFGRSESDGRSWATALANSKHLETVHMQHVGLAGATWRVFAAALHELVSRPGSRHFLRLRGLNVANNAVGSAAGAGALAGGLFALQVRHATQEDQQRCPQTLGMHESTVMHCLTHVDVSACGLSSLGLGKVLLALLHSGAAPRLQHLNIAHNPAVRALHGNLGNPHHAVSEPERAAAVAEDNSDLQQWADAQGLRIAPWPQAAAQLAAASDGADEHAGIQVDSPGQSLWVAVLSACISDAHDLRTLNLEGLHIGDGSFQLLLHAVVSSGRLHALTKLELGENLLGESSVKALRSTLASSSQQPALKRLGLSGNSAVKATYIHILRSQLPCCHVAFL